MTGFIVRRLLSAILVVILTSMFVFVLFFKGLGDSPARTYCEKGGPGKCSPEKLASIKHQMGYDKPLVYNYREWVKGIFVGRDARLQRRQALRLPRPVPRHLDHHQRAGVDRPQAEVSSDPRPRRRWRHDLPDARGLPRRHGRPMAGIVGRPTPRGQHARGLLHPVLRGGAAGVDLPLAPAEDLPEHRLLPDHRESSQDGVLHDAALAGDRADELHVVRPVHARPDGGDPQ